MAGKAQKNLTPEILVPRLGEYLVQQGHIDEAGLRKALAYQKKREATHEHCLLGQALLELHLIDRDVLDTAITEQIISLRNALENANKNLENRVRERTAELQDALHKLSELNQLKANFIANISHELRTPLTHVKGYLELLTSRSLGALSGEQLEALEVSQKAAGKLESLIDNLILFSLAVRGEMTLRQMAIDLGKIAAEVMEYSLPKAADRGVELKLDIHPGLPKAQADGEKITWALLQLVDNAIKFTPKGGNVTISIQPETDTLVQVAVSDTGIGIPENRLEEVFVAFHQLDGSPTRRYGGTGLGLALAQEILVAHGSKIVVNSKVGKGSTFRFPLLAANKSG